MADYFWKTYSLKTLSVLEKFLFFEKIIFPSCSLNTNNPILHEIFWNRGWTHWFITQMICQRVLSASNFQQWEIKWFLRRSSGFSGRIRSHGKENFLSAVAKKLKTLIQTPFSLFECDLWHRLVSLLSRVSLWYSK